MLATILVVVAGCAPEDRGGEDGRSGEVEEWIVFSSSRSGEGDLYGIGPGSEGPELVLGTAAPEGAVRYDPARNRLVHTRFDSAGGQLVSGTEELFRDPTDDFSPTWSTRGRVAYVVEGEGGPDLWVADRDAGEARAVTSDAAVERYPTWDAAGRRLVYAKRLDSGWDLHALELETGEETRLTFDGVYVGHPAWSHDGERVVFDRMYGDQTEIAVLDLSSGEIRRLTDAPGNDLYARWSRDGRRLVWAADREDNWDIWVMNADGTGARRLTFDPAFDGGPAFVPVSAFRGPER